MSTNFCGNGLIAAIPVDEEFARRPKGSSKKGWDMPAPKLKERRGKPMTALVSVDDMRQLWLEVHSATEHFQATHAKTAVV